MSDIFDAYHRWLGISPKDQPPNHYRLLGIDLFESDNEVIRDAAERQSRHVRSYELGQHARQAQAILNELAKAKACLLDPYKKATYDQDLRKRAQVDESQHVDEESRTDTKSEHGRLLSEDPAGTTALATEALDDHYSWLGIPLGKFPPSATQLLGLDAGQSSREQVQSAVKQRWLQLEPYLQSSDSSISRSAKALLDEIKTAALRVRGSHAIDHVPAAGDDDRQVKQQLAKQQPQSKSPFAIEDTKTRMRMRHRHARHSPARVWYFASGGTLVILISVVILVLNGAYDDVSYDDKELVPQAAEKPFEESPISPNKEPSKASPAIRQKPLLADLPLQTVDESKMLRFQIQLRETGMDDRPLRYRIVGGFPEGLSLDAATGTLQWRPSEEQGPGTYDVGVQVSSDPDFTFADTNNLSIRVHELNQPPQLAGLTGKSIEYGKELQFTIQAADPDIPANKLRYELVFGPEEAELDSATGVFRWIPSRDSMGSDVTIRVTDDGTPPMRAEREFRIRVQGVPVPDGPPLAKVPFDASQASAHQSAWAKHLGRPVEITNSIGMKFRLIPPGEFLMGSPTDEQERRGEETKHLVRITRPFWLSTYEVTQEEFQRVMGSNPSDFSKGAWKDQDTRRFPVERVTWVDAREFSVRLSGLKAESQSGFKYRLPTEAEWEYACRAGTTTPFHFGSRLDGSQANCDGSIPYGETQTGSFLTRLGTVGSYSANSFGLYDMHGNVWEWCADWWDSAYYGASPLEDPQAPERTSKRVLRGGSWLDTAKHCRAANRYGKEPLSRDNVMGFRVALVPDLRGSPDVSAVSAIRSSEPRQSQPQVDAKEPLPPLAIAPFDARQAAGYQEAWARHVGQSLEKTNSIGMKLKLIPPGEFSMGSLEDERDRDGSEASHRVRITQLFWMGVYEVTQQQYERVMGKNPSWFSSSGIGKERIRGQDTDRLPAENISWMNATEFCRRLSQRPEQRRDNHTYRLPTEAEWEYACRAGTETAFHFGSELNGREANCNGNLPYGTSQKGTYPERTLTVGSYSANSFGLYDMHGSVWEWCSDWFSADYYAGSPQADPPGPRSGWDRVLRGGSWISTPRRCRSACREARASDAVGSDLGFRVVLIHVRE